MRVAVVTWGSRGDFQPFLALARALLRAGHEAQLGGPRFEEYAAAAAGLGVPYVPLGRTVPYDGTAFRDLVDRTGRMRDSVRQFGAFMSELTLPWLDEAYAACLTLGDWADVLVSHVIQPAGRMAAETLGCRFVTGTLAHVQLPTRYRPPIGLPGLGPRSNRLLWRLASAYGDAVWAGGINRIRRGMGLAPLRDLLGDGFYSPDLNLVAVSRHVAAPPPDWSPRHHVTGYWFLDRPEWRPTPDLAEFMNRGPKPIAISLGSIATSESSALTHLLVRAVEQSGIRAVLQSGWAKLGQENLPPSIFAAGEIPHDWLFERVSAVVHHGGAGTTAAAFRAGVPAVFVPHINDQKLWARTALGLGVAPSPVARRELTADRLTRAIQAAARDARLRDRAARLRAAIRSEDGLAKAVGLVESYVEGTPRRPSISTRAMQTRRQAT